MTDNIGEEPLQMHNWMYSFLPVGDNNVPALVGYCKQCRRQFIQYMPLNIPIGMNSEMYQEYVTGVPKWGCVPILP